MGARAGKWAGQEAKPGSGMHPGVHHGSPRRLPHGRLPLPCSPASPLPPSTPARPRPQWEALWRNLQKWGRALQRAGLDFGSDTGMAELQDISECGPKCAGPFT